MHVLILSTGIFLLMHKELLSTGTFLLMHKELFPVTGEAWARTCLDSDRNCRVQEWDSDRNCANCRVREWDAVGMGRGRE